MTSMNFNEFVPETAPTSTIDAEGGSVKVVYLAVFAMIMRRRGVVPHLQKPCTASQQTHVDVNEETKRAGSRCKQVLALASDRVEDAYSAQVLLQGQQSSKAEAS